MTFPRNFHGRRNFLSAPLPDPGAIGFNQTQAVEHLRQLLVPWLGNAAADGDKLQIAAVDVDDNAAAEAVMPVCQRIEQRFGDGLLRVVLLFDSLQPLEDRGRAVAQRQKGLSVPSPIIHVLQTDCIALIGHPSRLKIVKDQ